MNENPFEQSTLQTPATTASQIGNTSATRGNGIEVRYPASTRFLVPIAVLASAFIAPAIVFFLIEQPLNYAIAAAMAITELSTAGFLWFLFNSSFVRADESGITKSQMGQMKTVRWEEIENVEIKEIHPKSPRAEYIFRDSQGRVLLQFTNFGNHIDGKKLREYITSQHKNN